MKTKYIIIVLLLVFAVSCKNETSTQELIPSIKLEGLILNTNEKWIVNEETHIGMKRIDSILKNNPSSNGKILGDKLSKQTSYIIKSCDMKGEAHDQLHVVLVPILVEITDLKDEQNASVVKQKTKKLQRLTATYFEYFKL
ncbi:hypothetical protein [Lacinutrix salivirga]